MIASTDSQIALVDTNIVVYAYDLDDPRKHTIARELIEQLSNQGRLVWSTQVFRDTHKMNVTAIARARLSGVLSTPAALCGR
jgi:predicted nucleic acid-binding protein